ncbi:MAG TPA: murein L,D-transpeptidase catalytic domain family protein [Sphingomonadaceae bacterium]|nr:murein L,D-transpeptidase catalytic domain family protein [Sphingomonadaceae bacterium]
MNFNRRHFIGAAIAGAAGLASPRAFAAVKNSVRPDLLPRAMAALDQHHNSILRRDVIGLVDFSHHSREQRFQIVDLGNGRVVASYLVAHGRGSDPANSGWATRFSNRPGSNASSEGSYRTGDTYYGKHGKSRRLIGLDPQNNLALQRAIVIHGANYVSPSLIDAQGRIGRSQGCFALEPRLVNEAMDRLGSGALIFAAN